MCTSKPLSLSQFIKRGFSFLLLLGLFQSGAVAQAVKTLPLIGSDASHIELKQNHVHATWKRQGKQSSVEFSSDASDAWPGFQIVPDRKWVLSKYDVVTAEVKNIGSNPAPVVLVVNNPGSNGQKNCSASSITVAPGKTGIVKVSLGEWHNKKQPLDRSRIVSLSLMFNQPKQPVRVVVGNFRAESVDRRGFEELRKTKEFAELVQPFGSGINLGNALDGPTEGAWGYRLEADHFTKIAKAGFDCVRLPVRWSAHTEKNAPYKIDDNFFQRVDWAIEQATKNRLQIIVNIHHFDELVDDPEKETAKFLSLWSQIAKRYADQPESVVFELLNEPHLLMTAGEWNQLIVQALAVIRPTNPTRRVVVGPVGWNAIKGLESLKLPADDKNLIATFHYYLPFRFTHQGATWVGQDTSSWIGTEWNGTRQERQAVTDDFDQALRWGIQNKRPIWMGEFGVINKADEASRVRWAKFVTEQAHRRKMGCTWWAFTAGFPIFDIKQNQWIAPLRDAVLMQGKLGK